MKKKRTISIILMTVLIFTAAIPAMGVGSKEVYGGELDSKTLEKAIVTAKTAIQVPSEYSEFEYNTYETMVNGKLRKSLSLDWKNPETGESIGATVNDNGYITNYSAYKKDSRSKKGLAKVTREDGSKKAAEFLKKAIPVYGAAMKPTIDKNAAGYGYTSDYRCDFKFFVNNVPVDFISATVNVNRYTGDVTSYNFNGNTDDFSAVEYPAITGNISNIEAAKAYVSEIGIDVAYRSYYDYLKKDMKIFPAYEVRNYGKAVDAKTGKVINLYVDSFGDTSNGATVADGEKEAYKRAEGLTEKEIAVLDSTLKLISKETAEKNARGLLPSLGKLKASNLHSDYINKDQYKWGLSFEEGYVTVDARTSELIGFYYYKERRGTGNVTKDRAKTIAEGFVKQAAPDKFAETKYRNDESMYNIEPLSNKAIDVNGVKDDPQEYNFNYVRQVNGVDFRDNSINVTVNKATGDIVSYAVEWYENAAFQSIEKAIAKEDAFKIFANEGSYGLVYKKAGVDKVALVYDFAGNSEILLNPISGKRIDWNGTLHTEKTKGYTDIKGNWAEDVIEELFANGYFLGAEASNTFMPKKKITQIEFLRYIYSRDEGTYPSDDEFYKMLVANGTIKKNEIAPNTSVTRQGAAKLVSRYMGLEKIASQKSVFKSLYRDKISAGYEGYVATCYGLDIMKGDANGYFNGERALTRAEAAKVIYQTVKAI